MVSIYSVHISGYNHKPGTLAKQDVAMVLITSAVFYALSMRTVYLSLKVRGEFIKLGLFQHSIDQPVIWAIKNNLAINSSDRKELVIFSLGETPG